MGEDGAEGLLRMRRAGARTVAQDRETSMVFGMPDVAHRMGAAQLVLGIEAIADYLSECAQPLRRSRRTE
jgi:two-component system chemotaxis response regulator CheB